MSENAKPIENVEDKELSDLLDSALKDFDDGSVPKSDESKSQQEKPETSNPVGNSNSEIDPMPQEWSTEFAQQAALQFEENFARLLASGDPNVPVSQDFVQEKLKQIADAAQQAIANPAEVSDQSVDFASSISQAIAGLNQGQESLKAPFSEDDLLKMFSGSGQEGDLLPFMQGMMQGLLSKEVLGPSLQEFVEKLPAYLEKNKDTLSKEDAERYQKQKELMEEVLEELNKENDSDSKEVKKDRFTKVLALMQKLQDYGQPPAELVGDVDSPFSFDGAGNPMGLPNMEPASNQECSIM